ncbi:MAG: 1-phosphofructokinase family hexose kinase [Rhodococcus sp.]|uniref:1-phosphofructokinase family hexose kinase n=1 Tax=Rhodococcus erythropolis TaxID=1833 RepID=UPI003D0F9FC6|nr:1-phosphofructokinase family hexose kinase [Rhodococcus sp. (in: high G+C Gram-positive bacteria)]
MIVTLTANPSIDRTVQLEQRLERGSVLRAHSTRSDPGGKGVNVARVLAAADLDVLAVLPGNGGDPLLSALAAGGIPHIGVATTGLARTNITIAEPDGTTTKINEPGATLSGSTLDALAQELIVRADTALWFALSGSLPPGVPLGWYGELVAALRDHPCKVAVDTSDAPLTALAEAFPGAAPDLLKPNGEELAQLTGVDGHVLERAAENGDPGPAITAAQRLVDRGVGSVLATLGAAGAVLVTAGGAWIATAPPIVAVSTVGAGDSSLAGYILAEAGGGSESERLRHAVAYGSAAASLPGTTLPTPEQIDLAAVSVSAADASSPIPVPTELA